MRPPCTGQVAFALAADVAEVWAVDQERGFIEFGERQAQRLGISNIGWVAGTAEEVPLDGVFDIVTIGNAFHRLEHEAVATRLTLHLVEAIDRDPHEQVLRRAGLVYEGRFEFPSVQRWTVDSLIGFVYSTSLLNRTVLAQNGDEFETDLRQQLLACRGDGLFEQDATFAYDLARRR